MFYIFWIQALCWFNRCDEIFLPIYGLLFHICNVVFWLKFPSFNVVQLTNFPFMVILFLVACVLLRNISLPYHSEDILLYHKVLLFASTYLEFIFVCMWDRSYFIFPIKISNWFSISYWKDYPFASKLHYYVVINKVSIYLCLFLGFVFYLIGLFIKPCNNIEFLPSKY